MMSQDFQMLILFCWTYHDDDVMARVVYPPIHDPNPSIQTLGKCSLLSKMWSQDRGKRELLLATSKSSHTCDSYTKLAGNQNLVHERKGKVSTSACPINAAKCGRNPIPSSFVPNGDRNSWLDSTHQKNKERQKHQYHHSQNRTSECLSLALAPLLRPWVRCSQKSIIISHETQKDE